VFVNASAGIDSPKALEGKRIGLRTWQTTAIHWIRGMLRDDYGVDLTSVHFFTQDEEDVPVIWPIKGYKVERVPRGRNVDEMLCQGDLDAVFYPETLQSIVRGDARVKRLWDDPKAEEIKYFQRTGLFPLMHTVVFHDRVLEQHPWAAVEMLQAFRRSKALAFQKLNDPRHVSLAWVQALAEEQKRLMGADPWSYDLDPSTRKHLELMIRWGVDFGLMPAQVEPEAFFFPSTLQVMPAYV
jgi:4,5-dihydroxyphthalate decarboxylase